MFGIEGKDKGEKMGRVAGIYTRISSQEEKQRSWSFNEKVFNTNIHRNDIHGQVSLSYD